MPFIEDVTIFYPANETMTNQDIINLAYDIVPARCVESIICEVGEIVPSEVPCHILPH